MFQPFSPFLLCVNRWSVIRALAEQVLQNRHIVNNTGEKENKNSDDLQHYTWNSIHILFWRECTLTSSDISPIIYFPSIFYYILFFLCFWINHTFVMLFIIQCDSWISHINICNKFSVFFFSFLEFESGYFEHAQSSFELQLGLIQHSMYICQIRSFQCIGQKHTVSKGISIFDYKADYQFLMNWTELTECQKFTTFA